MNTITITTTMANYALWTEGKVVRVTERRNNPVGNGVIIHLWWRPIGAHAGCWYGEMDVTITDHPKMNPPAPRARWGITPHTHGADDREVF